MADNDLMPVGRQILLPGIPERDSSIPPTRGKSGQRLTLRQKKFALLRLEGKAIGEAARLAGYSEKSADVIGSRLVNKSQVSEFIREQEEKVISEAGINRKDALLQLAKMVYWDPRTLYLPDGSIKPPSEWDDATAAVIAGVEVMEINPVLLKDVIATVQELAQATGAAAPERLGREPGDDEDVPF